MRKPRAPSSSRSPNTAVCAPLLSPMRRWPGRWNSLRDGLPSTAASEEPELAHRMTENRDSVQVAWLRRTTNFYPHNPIQSEPRRHVKALRCICLKSPISRVGPAPDNQVSTKPHFPGSRHRQAMRQTADVFLLVGRPLRPIWARTDNARDHAITVEVIGGK